MEKKLTKQVKFMKSDYEENCILFACELDIVAPEILMNHKI